MREKLPGVLVQAGMPGQDLPDRDGSITKQQVSGPMNTHSQNLAGPSPPSGQNTRHDVSSAWRCHESRFRAAIASSSGASSLPACATVPASVAGEISAPCRARPVTSEFADRPASNRSTSSIAVNPFVNRPFPIALGGPGAITVSGPSHRHSLLYRRLQFATRRMITCQSSCSPDQ